MPRATQSPRDFGWSSIACARGQPEADSCRLGHAGDGDGHQHEPDRQNLKAVQIGIDRHDLALNSSSEEAHQHWRAYLRECPGMYHRQLCIREQNPATGYDEFRR